MNSSPVFVLSANTKRETGKEAQFSNIQAAKAVSEIIRTTLGPRSMLKMILDPMGGIVLTNDGNAILREVDVTHPAAKSMIELSRTQDEEVGDGTTSVIILAGEIIGLAEPFLRRNIHSTIIVSAYRQALDDALTLLNKLSKKVDITKKDEVKKVVLSAIGTKFVSQFGGLIVDLAMAAVNRVTYIRDTSTGKKKEIDIKRYARVEKIPGGEITDSVVLDGVMIEKDIIHPNMKRKIENPRVVLLDCDIDYKKLESQAGMDIMQPQHFLQAMAQEEEHVKKMCNFIIAKKPTLVITEKGCSDLASHFFVSAGITVLRRLRKSDNNRVARATGATIIHRPDEIRESDVGNKCGLFEIRKIGDDYFTFLEKCRDAKSCTIILRGGSKDVLNEVERNLHDAMFSVRQIMLDPRICPGGGALEMALSHELSNKSKTIEGSSQWLYRAIGTSLEVIPRTLLENCGAHIVRIMTELRAKHAAGGGSNWTWGIDGDKGIMVDMNSRGIWDPFSVKAQTIKTAVESSIMLLRIDDIVSGISKKDKKQQGGGSEED